MIERPATEMKFVKSRDPLPTVEVDLDSIPEEFHGYGDLIVNAITPIAARSPNMVSTIYVYQGPSINFGTQTWSAFFAVAGEKKLLEPLLAAFRHAKVANARFSDSIDPSTGIKDFHVQDGQVWRPLEEGTWYATQQDEASDLIGDSDSATDCADSDDLHSETDAVSSRESRPARFRTARADASVGTIRKRIEEVFGLPEGSVALCDPDKRALRRDATIATLRKRWE